MKEKKKGSGIQKRYLRYTIFLLVFALLLSSVGVWFYVRKNMAGAIIDKYEFMTERMGIALDNLFEQSDSVTAECILYEDVQKSLQTQGLEEVNHIAPVSYTHLDVYKRQMVVYSIDEVFVDMTDYLKLYQLCPKQLARKVILDVLDTTGITAAAGIGTNLFLCKAAMDIVAKHIPADENGVRIAYLDEMQYRRLLWDHRPITDFWRVGRGYARRLEENGLFTMGDVARCSVWNEALLYRLFGKNAELLIDHAWGWEPCTVPAVIDCPACRHKKWRIIPAIHCLERKCMKGNSRRPFIRKI